VPPASTPGRGRNMVAIRRRDTTFELQVRSALHARGYRFRVDFPIRIEGFRPIRPDVVFTRRRLVIFCDGCFWHGCPEHGRRPSIRNGEYWTPKIAGNVERDQRHTAALRTAGWTVLRFWEHEETATVLELVTQVLERSSEDGRGNVRRMAHPPYVPEIEGR
jgi:DNA mismatch endonuclease (patch repair protein)